MMAERVKKGLLVFMAVFMFLPGVFYVLPVIDSGFIFGSYYSAEDVKLSAASWMDGSYQQGKEKYVNEQVGFRKDFLRINNQVEFSLFGKMHFWGAMEGSQNTIWMRNYIEAYLGQDHIGYNGILTGLVKLKKVQDTLAAMGTTLVWINAPNKAWYYPEYLPEEMKNMHKGPTNLDVFVHIADSLGINNINFNAWFVALKNKTPENLYPKQSTHWSVYGSQIAADSMIRYVEQMRNIHMPRITINNITHTTKAKYVDAELKDLLNIILPYYKEIYTYADIGYTNEEHADKPKAIYIGDSFTFHWAWFDLWSHINKDWQFWNSFRLLQTPGHRFDEAGLPSVHSINWVAELEKADYVALVYTATSLPNMANGFIDSAYQHYYPNDTIINKQ